MVIDNRWMQGEGPYIVIKLTARSGDSSLVKQNHLKFFAGGSIWAQRNNMPVPDTTTTTTLV